MEFKIMKKIGFWSFLKLIISATLISGIVCGLFAFIVGIFGANVTSTIGTTEINGFVAGLINLILFPVIFTFIGVIVGEWGTHVDAPAHFAKGKRTLDQIKVSEMLLPLVVIDVHAKVKKNSDYVVTLDDIKSYERKYGKIPTKAFVALRTDWSKRWPDIRRMQNKDKMGISHYPGWSLDVLKFLYEKRKITASGQETLDTDPGIETSKNRYPLESYILGTDHYQIELLANLDEVPEYGALVVVAFPKPEKGAGFPARVFAIAP